MDIQVSSFMDINDWPIAGTSEFVAAFRRGPTGRMEELSNRDDTENLNSTIAFSAISVLDALLSQEQLSFCILRCGNFDCVISAKSQIVILGRAGLNVGLTIGSMSSAASDANSRPDPDSIRCQHGQDQLSQRLVEVARLIERSEVPRQYCFSAGKKQLSLLAEKGRFKLFGARSTPADLATFCEQSVSLKQKLKYTISEIKVDAIGIEDHPLSLFLSPNESVGGRDDWLFSSDLSLLSFPSNQTLQTFLSCRALVSAMRQYQEVTGSENQLRMDGFDANRQKLCSASILTDGDVSLQFSS